MSRHFRGDHRGGQDVRREYARKKGLEETAALEAGLKEKAEEFRKSGSEIYLKQ